MKELYAEYKDKGVEFIGISLDNPPDGLAKLKNFVAKNDIPWPQYYQRQGFSRRLLQRMGRQLYSLRLRGRCCGQSFIRPRRAATWRR